MFRYFLGIFGAGIFLLVLNSCSHAIFSKKDKIEELSTKAIFLYLQQPEEYLSGMFIGKGKVKLDPLLCQRVGLNKNGKVYFDDPMDSEVLKKSSSQKIYQLEIPDSLKAIFEYTGSDQDFEHDYAIIHQFSQLLPTTEPNIHLMEHYNWTNGCGKGDKADTSCIRILNREYLKFKIEGKKIKLLEGLLLNNQLDFIGLGYFSRKKMEDALPGEKITKFGW